MKIKSKTDLITNSSSEVFSIRAFGKTKEEILKLLEDFHETSRFSGSYEDYYKGENRKNFDPPSENLKGQVRILNFQDRVEREREYLPKSKKELYSDSIYCIQNSYFPEETEKDVITLDIDWDYERLCRYIFATFNVVESDGGWIRQIYDKSGEKIVGVIDDWGEFEKLSELEKYGKDHCENYNHTKLPEDYYDFCSGTQSFEILGKTKKEILEVLEKKYPGKRYYVMDFQDRFEESKTHIPKNKLELWTEELYFISYSQYPSLDQEKDVISLYIDVNEFEICKFVIKNFTVIFSMGGLYYSRYDKTGERVIELTESEIYNNNDLTKLEIYGKLFCENYC